VAALERILAGLNSEQREAAMATRGPVAILAGAGTGKTTTITRRIACQVASGAFDSSRILAVTFTSKAAGELRNRLAGLGVDGVEARTFHSAALSQLSGRWSAHTGEPLPEILDHKAPLIASLAGALPVPYKFLPRRDLAGEIEWAKNRMIPPSRYLDSLGEHTPPIPPDLMLRLYEGYERRKRRTGRLDFEDMLGLAIRLYDEHPEAAAWVRGRYLAFTVDEYQDVNPLQAALLERWRAGRDELCVVGDDYQSIYSFTGATPSYLLGFREVFPHARVIQLEDNYRSTPQILAAANRVARRLAGHEKHLRSTMPGGPAPVVRGVANGEAEVELVVGEVRRLHQDGTAFEEMAVLYRVNARSEPFEEAFAAAGIPYQVRDGAFLRRPGPRAVISRLRRSVGSGVPETVEDVTEALGYDALPQPHSDEELTRQADLGRLRAMAAEFGSSRPGDAISEFLTELTRRFSAEESGRGVNLLTYHRAKGMEFDAVFLPRLLDDELPFRSGRSKADELEERRLLYVGITRARRHLFLTWPGDTRAERSRFLAELGLPESQSSPARARKPVRVPAGGPLFDALKRWRLERAKADGVPAYVVFHDSTLAEIAARRPRSRDDLHAVPGIGPAKLDRYADEVLALVSAG
jgi:DNA helicase-2/ATP-dependent DNA helicase PcrA